MGAIQQRLRYSPRVSRGIKESFAGDKQTSKCQRAESWEQGRALPSDVKIRSVGMLGIFFFFFFVSYP